MLLMDRSGSVGLDLSFAPHVFLMEPFLDAALEAQVVSRAHRMGARAPVHVEMLVMKARTSPPSPFPIQTPRISCGLLPTHARMALPAHTATTLLAGMGQTPSSVAGRTCLHAAG